MNMQAAVWTDWDRIEIKTVPEPKPWPGYVKIKIISAGVCTTDVHVYTGKFKYGSPPHVLGHEIAGVVDCVGRGCRLYKPGDRVLVETSIGCGICRQCAYGNRHLCSDMTEIGFSPHQGGYSQYVCVPEQNLVSLPDSISFDEGGIFESSLCAVGALYRLGVNLGSVVAVIGVGVAGLSFIQGAKAMGAGTVIAIARNMEALKRAERFGADISLPLDDQTVKFIDDLGGCDLVCEAAGAGATIELSMTLAKAGGRVILYGIPSDDEFVQYPVTKIVTRQLSVFGAVGNPSAWGPVLHMVEKGHINLNDMITHRFALSEIHKAFDLIKKRDRSLIKAVVHPWK